MLVQIIHELGYVVVFGDKEVNISLAVRKRNRYAHSVLRSNCHVRVIVKGQAVGLGIEVVWRELKAVEPKVKPIVRVAGNVEVEAVLLGSKAFLKGHQNSSLLARFAPHRCRLVPRPARARQILPPPLDCLL